MPAPCDVVLSDVDVVQPDLLLVLNLGKARITEKNIQGPPDLLVEILSPSTASRDRDLKRKRYEYYGVCESWLVNPVEKTIDILALTGATFVEIGKGASHTAIAFSLLPDLPLEHTKLFA